MRVTGKPQKARARPPRAKNKPTQAPRRKRLKEEIIALGPKGAHKVKIVSTPKIDKKGNIYTPPKKGKRPQLHRIIGGWIEWDEDSLK
jgi:hypothetical protein